MRLTVLILILLTSFSVLAQQPSREELERRRQNILEAIRVSQAQLDSTKRNKNASLSQLRALQIRLDARQRLIGNINDEIGSLNNNIVYSTQEIGNLNNQLELLKVRYAQSIRYAYKNRSSYNMLAFIFSSGNFNDALRRLKYMKRYRDYRARQAEEIRFTKARIAQTIGVLNTEKSRKDLLLAAEEQQRQVLQHETTETNNVVKQLKGKEQQLLADIAKNQKSIKQMNRVINDLIARELEIARKKAEEERRLKEEADRKAAAAAAARAATYGTGPGGGVRLNTGTSNPPAAGVTPKPGGVVTNPGATAPSNPPAAGNVPPAATVVKPRTGRAPAAPVNLNLTPEAQQLAANFAASKGRLPWPVEKGIITSGFGTHQHPLYNKVTVENMGVDIQTSAGAGVRAVYNGTVSGVVSVPGMGNIVLINHGDYFTAYANMASVSVKRGDVVQTKQTIGTVGNNDEGLPVLNFQVWKGAVKMNPESWIAK